jgi:hypothetical protein
MPLDQPVGVKSPRSSTLVVPGVALYVNVTSHVVFGTHGGGAASAEDAIVASDDPRGPASTIVPGVASIVVGEGDASPPA